MQGDAPRPKEEAFGARRWKEKRKEKGSAELTLGPLPKTPYYMINVDLSASISLFLLHFLKCFLID